VLNSGKLGQAARVAKPLFAALLLLNLLGWPVYWGYVGKPVIAPFIWALLATTCAVLTGWRKGGVLRSLATGLGFALLAFVPLFFVGRLLSAIRTSFL
jgi:hypothetical protein